MRMPRFGRGLVLAVSGVPLLAELAEAQETTRVSVDSAGVEGNWHCYGPAISEDGRCVAFAGSASNLVAGDTNGVHDVFVHDRDTGVTERISVDSSGAEGNGDSRYPSISADGMVVAFESVATNLVIGDTNGASDVFVHDRSTGVTERVSVRPSGKQASGPSFEPSISADGLVVAFHSRATNLVTGDTNGTPDVFVRDRAAGATERVSVDSAGAEADARSEHASISADGQRVAFDSDATNLVSGDVNGLIDVFVHDRSTALTERVSVDSVSSEGNGDSTDPSISGDGRFVAFPSFASNLVSGDTNVKLDVFVRDLQFGLTERVSVDSSGVEGNGESVEPSISSDGAIVAFESLSTHLVGGDTNTLADVFLRDRSAGTTRRASVDSSGAEANDRSFDPAISADGQHVTFASLATNLVAGDTNGFTDVFVHCNVDATWTTYGAGWPGTLGVPTMLPSADPVLGTKITITISDSLGVDTPAILLIGFAEANVPTSKGGTLLVAALHYVPLLVPIAGYALTANVPSDPTLCDFEVDLQTLEVDGGATRGVSFTDGLKLLLGH